MRHVLMITAALALLGVVASPASAQKLDKNGKCHAANGQFAKQEVCAGAPAAKGTTKTAAAAPAAAADPHAPYKLDAKGKCHDVKGKMASKSKCAA